MEVSQDFSNRLYALKGKRSKRSRPTSPLYLAGTTTFTTSSSTFGGSDDGGHGGGGDFYYSSSIQYSPTASTTQISTSSTSEEDEDMANCLILLAQSGGCRKVQVVSEVKKDKISSRKFTEMVSTTTGKAGFYVYECKTCNRTFPSFQALGGHRASHKRPKTIVLEEKKTANVTATATDSLADNINEDHSLENDQEDGQFNKLSPSLPIKIVVNNNNNKKGMNSHDNCNSSSKTKIHECSICGSEFSSGQALGGHMRRHRPPTTASPITKISTDIETISNIVSESSQKNFLSLDLNLPAPSEDDVRDTKFDFSANQQSLVFSTSALVDCHY